MKVTTVVNDTQSQSPEESVKKGKAEKKAGKRIGYNYIVVKSLKESKKNDVVKCLYIKSLMNWGFCVIKEGTYGDTKDKQGRDIRDRLIWQKELHEQLQDKVRVPRLLGYFEENGNYYLVIERIRGKSLASLCKKHRRMLREGLINGNKTGIQFLGYLIQMIELLGMMHKEQVVHRDASAANFMITPKGKVAVIDLELSYSVNKKFPTPAFELGTHGYMSPQQEAMQTPTVFEDIFAVGAVILQVWTNISPNKMTNGMYEELKQKVHFFIPDGQIAEIVSLCLHPDPTQRPALTTIQHELQHYKNDLKKEKKRSQSNPVIISESEILDTIQKTVNTLASPLLADEDKGWFSENIKEPPHPDKNKINKAWYGSFNLGVSGIIYSLSIIKKIGIDVKIAMPKVQKGLELIEDKYILNGVSSSPSLHFGSSGVAATLAIAMESGLLENKNKYVDWIDQLLNKDNSRVFEFMYGTSGQGIANIICADFLNPPKLNERLYLIVQDLIVAQEKNGAWVRDLKGNKKRVTRGFAHGMAGIIYFLLEYAQQYNNQEAMSSAERGLDWLIKKAVVQKEAIIWKSSRNRDILPWWCEGSPGISLAFLKAYTIFKDPAYKRFASGALQNHPVNILDNNLGQCHGLSGLGEIYLEGYSVLQEEQWLKRAGWIAQALMHVKKKDAQYGPYWIIDHERQPVAGFMNGNCGVLHFLLRYCFPGRISFPLLPSKKDKAIFESGSLNKILETRQTEVL